MPSNITPQRVPLVDTKTGLITTEWYRFLFSLFELTGAGQNSMSLTDLQQAPPAIPNVATGATAVAGRFYATLSSSTALTGASDETVVCDNEVYDTTNEYDATTGIFTATEDSVWSFTVGIGYRSLADQTNTRSYLWVNSTSYQFAGGNSSGANSRLQGSSSFTFEMSAGDTLHITAYVPSAGPSVEGGGPCFIYGKRLS